ncbi:hypothetical protein BT63DRAFT_457051 [Microthyrium microscopicum]|uniref:Zn(2)-C6 fungal-type domain-containing protein n=1 Tax=Microthyrium microscopicum TaxID=703497 RepID=A0A6A6U678_9PEZI|nr:hypothetical protein BT63DRAFT_457051 [Microthyrium microscopicum]
MSLVPDVTVSMAGSASPSEKSASSPAFASTPASTTTSVTQAAPKKRSCAICRRRKVRCDKQSPCSNCRRANIACVYPATDRPPRWARRLERLSNEQTAQDAEPGVEKIMDRLRTLENLVKELNGQLEQAQTDGSSNGAPSTGNSPGSSTQDRDGENHASPSSPAAVQKQFGRLVLQKSNRSRYVSTGFWSRINDELDGLKTDTRELEGDASDSSEDEASPGKSPPSQELNRSPLERNAFLFRNNLNPASADLHEFHPLPSQIPFLLDMFSENVNFLLQSVHMPTAIKLIRDMRSTGMTHVAPNHEALFFSIYYAAITSMEEEDVMTNFNSSKADLSLKFRIGLERALAKADFLNAPDIVLVQAFALFLMLVRRHDSPRYVWMMTGLIIRMAQYLGLQRDGAQFGQLTPYEIETRRKVWWCVCALDLRASEDQGTDLTIAMDSFDTKVPLNINDTDISPETKVMPVEREGLTDMSMARIQVGMITLMRQITASVKDGSASLDEQGQRLSGLYKQYEDGYLRYASEDGNILYWVGVTVARLVMAKMTLLVFLPVLFASPTKTDSEPSAESTRENSIRAKLLIAAIEVAEYNHALNDNQRCRNWRWIYQTYTHWYAIVYLLIETCRREWSPIVERAWTVLHSSWLIPSHGAMDRKQRIWVPLRRMMAKAKRHRDAELNKLRADPDAVARLDAQDENVPLPTSPEPFSEYDDFRSRWRQLVSMPVGMGFGTPASHGAADLQASNDMNSSSAPSNASIPSTIDFSMNQPYQTQPSSYQTQPALSGSYDSSAPVYVPTYLPTTNETHNPIPNFQHATNSSLPQTHGQTGAPTHGAYSEQANDWFSTGVADFKGTPWLWGDFGDAGMSDEIGMPEGVIGGDPGLNVGMDGNEVNMESPDVNWYNWIESARGMELDASPWVT